MPVIVVQHLIDAVNRAADNGALQKERNTHTSTISIHLHNATHQLLFCREHNPVMCYLITTLSNLFFSPVRQVHTTPK